jgi:hypothetical protein
MIQDRNLLSLMEAEEKEWQTIGDDDDVNIFVVA